MGLKRLLWRSNFLGQTIDTIRNIIDEEDVVEGTKRTIKENICEDNPIGKAIYNIGTYDGKKPDIRRPLRNTNRNCSSRLIYFCSSKKFTSPKETHTRIY